MSASKWPSDYGFPGRQPLDRTTERSVGTLTSQDPTGDFPHASPPGPTKDVGATFPNTRCRTKLWSRAAVASWAASADLRSPQEIASAELKQLRLVGAPLAQGHFRSTFSLARQHALGGGRKPREVARSRKAAYQVALDQASKADPAFRVEMPDGWFDEA